MKSSPLIVLLCTLTLLSAIHGAGARGSAPPDLPLINVYSPDDHRNVPVTSLSFAELDVITMSAPGREWNDMTRLCDSMYLLYGRYGQGCAASMQPRHRPSRVMSFATVGFTILPSPQQPFVAPPTGPVPVPIHGPILVVDPVYPPWPPTYNPYW
jgi:hypothetical protein